MPRAYSVVPLADDPSGVYSTGSLPWISTAPRHHASGPQPRVLLQPLGGLKSSARLQHTVYLLSEQSEAADDTVIGLLSSVKLLLLLALALP